MIRKVAVASLALFACSFMSVQAYADDVKIYPAIEASSVQEAEYGASEAGNNTESYSVDPKTEIIADNARFWRGNNKLLSIGFATGSFDLGKYNGGKLTSRWGASLKMGRNIMLHPKPIANVVKFGLFIGADVTYLNFEKGHGSLSGILGGDEEDDDYDYGYDDDYEYDEDIISLGSHYITAGLAIGPTATVMPFFWSRNPNVARIKVRPFFQVVPSYSALLISNEDDMEVHGAFTCLFAGGFELMWRKLSIGFEWKGGRARYKDLVGDLMDDIAGGTGNVWVGASTQKTPRYGCKMFSISIGLAL